MKRIFAERVDLLVGRLLDQRAVAIDEQDLAHARRTHAPEDAQQAVVLGRPCRRVMRTQSASSGIVAHVADRACRRGARVRGMRRPVARSSTEQEVARRSATRLRTSGRSRERGRKRVALGASAERRALADTLQRVGRQRLRARARSTASETCTGGSTLARSSTIAGARDQEPQRAPASARTPSTACAAARRAAVACAQRPAKLVAPRRTRCRPRRRRPARGRPVRGRCARRRRGPCDWPVGLFGEHRNTILACWRRSAASTRVGVEREVRAQQERHAHDRGALDARVEPIHAERRRADQDRRRGPRGRSRGSARRSPRRCRASRRICRGSMP